MRRGIIGCVPVTRLVGEEAEADKRVFSRGLGFSRWCRRKTRQFVRSIRGSFWREFHRSGCPSMGRGWFNRSEDPISLTVGAPVGAQVRRLTSGWRPRYRFNAREEPNSICRRCDEQWAVPIFLLYSRL